MPVSIFEGCTEWCGWPAALLAILGFGSFGVPIKGASNVDVDPFVMQSYKTLTCFITCWFVYFLGEEIRFTSWGIISGIFWVPAAACGIYGIRNAGLAICVGVWSSCYVVMSFVWGILIFKEEVKNVFQTGLAFCILGIGLVGMSTYSKPPPKDMTKKAFTGLPVSNNNNDEAVSLLMDDEETSQLSKRKTITTTTNTTSSSSKMQQPFELESQHTVKSLASDMMNHATIGGPHSITPLNLPILSASSTGTAKTSLTSSISKTTPTMEQRNQSENNNNGNTSGRMVFCGIVMTRRQLGVLGAIVNGTWGGLNLIPLHFAKREGFGGAAYLVSYAVGSMIVNTIMWILLFLYHFVQRKYHVRDALDALPDFQLEKLWGPGFLAGFLYSIANFGSILAVTYLGQGVGFSLCQVQILVSGLWGIFYFKEIKGRDTITKWVISACITVCGILWLTYQKSH